MSRHPSAHIRIELQASRGRGQPQQTSRYSFPDEKVRLGPTEAQTPLADKRPLVQVCLVSAKQETPMYRSKRLFYTKVSQAHGTTSTNLAYVRLSEDLELGDSMS